MKLATDFNVGFAGAYPYSYRLCRTFNWIYSRLHWNNFVFVIETEKSKIYNYTKNKQGYSQLNQNAPNSPYFTWKSNQVLSEQISKKEAEKGIRFHFDD